MAAGSRRRTQARRPRKGGGGGGMFSKVIGIVLGAAIIFAIYGIPYNPTVSGVWAILVSKSETVKGWMTGVGQDVESGLNDGTIGGGGTAPGTGGGTAPGTGGGTAPGGDTPTTPEQTSAVVGAADALMVANADNSKYNRDEWNHWVSQGSGCWDTRDQVLYDEAVKDATLKLVDKNKKETTDVASACAVTAGTWNDPYTGGVYTNPKKLDIDHMIPLGYAAKHGGQAWDENKKEAYANDLSDAGHLVAVDLSANRQKSDNGPSVWKPANTAFYCAYATDWVNVATHYGLSVTKEDKAALKDMLATC